MPKRIYFEAASVSILALFEGHTDEFGSRVPARCVTGPMCRAIGSGCPVPSSRISQGRRRPASVRPCDGQRRAAAAAAAAAHNARACTALLTTNTYSPADAARQHSHHPHYIGAAGVQSGKRGLSIGGLAGRHRTYVARRPEQGPVLLSA